MDQFMEDELLPKYLHSILKLLLFTFAVFPKDYRLFRSICYWILIIIVGSGILGSIIPLYMTTERILKLELFTSVIPQLTDLLTFIYFSHKRRQLLEAIHSFASFNSSDVLERTSRFFETKFVKYFILHAAWASLFMLHTIIYILSNEEFSDKYSLMLPFWLSCNIKEENHLCWKPNTSLELWLANIITGIVVGFDYHVYCAALLLYSVFMTNVWIHLETLKISIRVLAARMKSQCRTNFVKFGKSDEYDNFVIEELNRTIKYQQFIRTYCNEIMNLMRGYISIFLVEFWGGLVFCAFVAITEVKNERALVIKSSIVFVSAAIGFVIHCVYAQKMIDSNEMILGELADIPWYEQSMKFRQIYLMCLTHHQKSVRVTAVGIFTFSYGFSMNCLKTMYSFLNMLIIRYKR